MPDAPAVNFPDESLIGITASERDMRLIRSATATLAPSAIAAGTESIFRLPDGVATVGADDDFDVNLPAESRAIEAADCPGETPPGRLTLRQRSEIARRIAAISL
ncbi:MULTISPECIES: hypothetical protein [Methylomonas]|nr:MULTISPECIES: hypothetical protein [Methylomonas]